MFVLITDCQVWFLTCLEKRKKKHHVSNVMISVIVWSAGVGLEVGGWGGWGGHTFPAAVIATAFKLCLMTATIELYSRVPVSVTLASFQGHWDIGRISSNFVHHQ